MTLQGIVRLRDKNQTNFGQKWIFTILRVADEPRENPVRFFDGILDLYRGFFLLSRTYTEAVNHWRACSEKSCIHVALHTTTFTRKKYSRTSLMWTYSSSENRSISKRNPYNFKNKFGSAEIYCTTCNMYAFPPNPKGIKGMCLYVNRSYK